MKEQPLGNKCSPGKKRRWACLDYSLLYCVKLELESIIKWMTLSGCVLSRAHVNNPVKCSVKSPHCGASPLFLSLQPLEDDHGNQPSQKEMQQSVKAVLSLWQPYNKITWVALQTICKWQMNQCLRCTKYFFWLKPQWFCIFWRCIWHPPTFTWKINN